MPDIQNLYDKVDYIAHSLSPRQEYGGMVFKRDGQPAGFFGIEFHCDTQARAYCPPKARESDDLVDYILLTHNLRFIPQVSTAWRGWDRYRFHVRALDENASSTLHQGDAIPADELGNWFDNENAAGTLRTASVLSSIPPTSNVGHSFSASVGQNMGFSAGFFGSEPTASYSQGEDMSTSASYSLDSESIQDFSGETTINKQFTINHLPEGTTMARDQDAQVHTDPGFTTFEVTVAELFRVPDDGKGDRSKTHPTTFRHFEIAITAERDTRNDDWTSEATMDRISYTTNARQIISVKAPPLPKPGSDTQGDAEFESGGK